MMPNNETITANTPIKIKLSSALPISLVEIKKAIEHAIPPKGGTRLVESLFSFLLLCKLIFFEYL